MPRKNQIPFLVSRTLAGGRITWYWTPSPKLRAQGYKRELLGDDFAAAVARAIAINTEVDAGAAPLAIAAEAKRTRPINFAELVDHYKSSGDWKGLKPKSQVEYSTWLRVLVKWAEDGRTLVRSIDNDMVLDLRNALVAEDRKYRTAAILRVLRIIMGYAKRQRFISVNPAADDLRVPEPPKRRARLLRDDLSWLQRAAGDLKYDHIRLAIVLGFYTMQRQADLLATTRFRMSAIRDISAEARRILAGPDGRVLGICLIQEKTDVPVAIPLVPLARAAIEATLGTRTGGVAGTYLIVNPRDAEPTRACPDWQLQRDFREVRMRAIKDATAAVRNLRAVGRIEAAEDAAEALDRLRIIQYRDLRRSGMCWMRDLGVAVPLIASISGHSIEHTQKILDTYLPRDTRSAAEGMAIAVSRQAERDAEDEAGREGTVEG